MTIDPALVARNIADVRGAIAARTDRAVALVAVTKGFDEMAVAAALGGGADGIGENYAQELIAKAALLAGTPDIPWHFIGQLQRNKVRPVSELGIALWQTVDRVELGRELARRAPGAGVLVQVNVTDEPQKGGCPPGDASTLVSQCRDLGLSVQGLMTIGPAGAAEAARPGFRQLRRFADELGLDHCSMGMSADFEVAVDEGATMVRIGSRLFGPRG